MTMKIIIALKPSTAARIEVLARRSGYTKSAIVQMCAKHGLKFLPRP